jgi:hypothetical protein
VRPSGPRWPGQTRQARQRFGDAAVGQLAQVFEAMASTMESELRLVAIELSMLWRIPVTTTVWPASAAGGLLGLRNAGDQQEARAGKGNGVAAQGGAVSGTDGHGTSLLELFQASGGQRSTGAGRAKPSEPVAPRFLAMNAVC